tara:strand:- start:14994 stop:15989 length:996 start_codon:yes stop_codon:yes gene_type:complete
MRIIILGGAGFIGINFLKTIIKNKKYNILNIDKLSYASNKKEIKKLSIYKNYTFKKIDISNYSKINNAINAFKPNRIINFAAETHVDNSIKSSLEFVKSNYLGTYNLLLSSQNFYNKLSALNKKKFIFFQISTDEVYGSLKKNDNKFTEEHQINPRSPYSATKAGSDHLVKSWFHTYNLPVFVSHCSNNFGPFQHKEKLIPKTIECCINKKTIPIYGKGKQIREWIYVQDHVEAILHILKFGKIGQSYNIGSGFEIENINLVKQICRIYNELSKSSFNTVKLIKFVQDRPGHDFRYSLNSKKIKNLKWNNKYNFEISLTRTIIWYMNNIKK